MLSHDAFRKAGKTISANYHPLSPRAQRVMAEHSGVAVSALPETFRYAANAGMRVWLDMLGEAMDAGKPTRQANGAWLTPRMLMEVPHDPA